MVSHPGVAAVVKAHRPQHTHAFGANVVVCPGVTIGENCVIGAGSVVTRDIPAGSFAAGNPARVIRPITAADTVRGRFPGIRGE